MRERLMIYYPIPKQNGKNGGNEESRRFDIRNSEFGQGAQPGCREKAFARLNRYRVASPLRALRATHRLPDRRRRASHFVNSELLARLMLAFRWHVPRMQVSHRQPCDPGPGSHTMPTDSLSTPPLRTSFSGDSCTGRWPYDNHDTAAGATGRDRRVVRAWN